MDSKRVIGAIVALVIVLVGAHEVREHFTPTSTLGPITAPPVDGSALSALHQLAVKGRAPNTGYTRQQFGQAWSDDVDVPGGHNGCDTRNDILGRDLTATTFKPGTRDCVVLAGTYTDPYTGTSATFQRGPGSNSIHIDHVVSLQNAWQTGAQQLTLQQRTNLANDPLGLRAVQAATNLAKGAGDAATWLPPKKDYRCTYVAIQVTVKAKYHLWVTPAERDAIASVLATCPHQPLSS